MEVIGAKGEVEESWGGRKVPRQGRGADGCTEGADGRSRAFSATRVIISTINIK